MKNRIPFKILTLVLTLLLCTMGCQEEDFRDLLLETEQVEPEVQAAEGPKMDVVMGEDIPEILEGIAAKTATSFSKVGDLDGKIRFNNAMINLRRAKRVRNPNGVTNFTFDLFPDDSPENAFYTLVVSKAKNGTMDEPYVIGYEMTDADFESFMAHDMDFRYFKAEQRFYNFDSFFVDSKNNRVGKAGDCGGGTIGSDGNGGGGHTAPGETFTHNYNGTLASTTFGTRQNANLYNYHITIGDSGASGSTASTTASSNSLEVLGQMPDGWGTPDPLPVTVYLSTPSSVNITIEMNNTGGSPCIKANSINDSSIFTNITTCPPPHQLKGGTASKGTDCIAVVGGVSISVNLAVKKIYLALDRKLSTLEINALTAIEDTSQIATIYNFLEANTSEEAKNRAIYTIKVMIDPATHAQWASHFAMQCAILKFENPSWSDTKIYWEASKEMVHFVLDMGGLVPVVGEVCDLTNGVIYTVEGDGVNATLSFAAAIPIVGWWATGAKFAKRAINIGNGSKTTLKWAVNASNIINFGDRGQLRKVLKLAVGDSRQAHHIIPWGRQSHRAVQKSAKAKSAFHMNEVLNGFPIQAWRNQPNHNIYDAKVEALLNQIPSNLSANQTYSEVAKVINRVKNAIKNNPNTHLNDLVL